MKEHKCLITRYDPRDYTVGDGHIALRGTGNPDWTGNCWFEERQRFSYDNDCCIVYAAQKSFDAQVDRMIQNGEVDKSIVDWFTLNGYMDSINSTDGKPHFHTSERFVSYNTGNGFNGNAGQDPWIAMRKFGFIPWTDWPFDATISEQHYFDRPPQTLFDKGLLALATIGGKDSIQYHWIFQNTNGNATRSVIDAARLTAPTVFGVVTNDGWNSGIPTPPAIGTPPNHGVMNPTVNQNGEIINDDYTPFLKALGPTYPIPQVIQGVVSIKPPSPAPTLPPNATKQQQISFLQKAFSWLLNIWEGITPQGRAKLGSSKRSPHWEAFKKEFAKTHLPVCAICGGTKQLNLHHLKPFHAFPGLELDPTNVIWLCNEKRHHIDYGHLGDFKSINPTGKADIELWRDKIRTRPMTIPDIETAFQKVETTTN